MGMEQATKFDTYSADSPVKKSPSFLERLRTAISSSAERSFDGRTCYFLLSAWICDRVSLRRKHGVVFTSRTRFSLLVALILSQEEWKQR
ncbi:hypothetical protein Y032_0131g1663 [Ancylostoma ceylanicum]|uniref:Uncharacterized protein n=1 Tax=Ancylostoma ceylanicum TaxID=53326 RepID=A0A016T782_9BILA|nr:hypothetical protein Y032_0131g1663 [Ancylostoma ceylanicum]